VLTNAAQHLAIPAYATGLADALRKIRLLAARIAPERSLITEILGLQFLVSLLIGALAIVGLWWASTWAIEDSLKRWGHRWIAELDDLGVPLYTSENEDRFLQIESYLKSFPEISFVRYYGTSGELVFEDLAFDGSSAGSLLTAEYLEQLGQPGAGDQSIVLDAALNDSSLVRISKPIWTESFKGDGLLGVDLMDESAVETSLLGFVELGLNFSAYETQLSRNITLGSIFGVLLMLLVTSASGVFFRRALTPLSELEKPLKDLARGKTDFSVESSGHRELVAIADALNTTVTALNERDKKLWQLANHDSLTGLMNRHQFGQKLVEEMERVKGRNFTSALLFVDLDQFKYVNDTLGHAAGDRLLKQAAELIKNAIRKDDIVSRFGGDEFTILLSDVKEKDVKAVCEGLLHDLRDHHFHDGSHTFNVPCSIGVAMITSANLAPAELLARADVACHEAKTRGRNRYEIYRASGAEMRQMTADVGWSQKIKKALKEDLFTLHYQPIVEISSGKPTHYEVLLRMRSNKKLVPPTAFLPAASRFGLMTEVDEWVIRNAMKTLAEFRANGKDFVFTLNISGNIFEDADLYQCIAENLSRNNLPANRIVLEITEQVAVRNVMTAAEQISEISKLGCRFAIDDFGAGYSSYTYLKSLPVDYIKIDGSFIQNLGKDKVDQTIVSSICHIAKATNKKTIAEHVKDAETFRVLHELGVDFAQGHYAGKPAARPAVKKVAVPIRAAKRRRKAS
jgi:diguanylate cyclase (GGDEF)-like protein